MEKQSVFISYAHSDTNPDRVKAFIYFLEQYLPRKISLLFDKKYLGIGKNIPKYMELLKKVPVAIILFSPAYKKKIETAVDGVFEEYSIIRERLATSFSAYQEVCILFLDSYK